MNRWPGKVPPPPKECKTCHQVFERKPGSPYAAFAARQYCSRKCSATGQQNGGRFVGGTPPWNKGKKCPQLILNPESRAKKSASLKAAGTGKWRKGMAPWNKGKRLPHLSGENNANWKGGVTVKTRGLRWSSDYAEWRRKVFARDDYTCVFCGQHGGQLNADHIKPLLFHPELIFDLENGRTLCVACHRKTDTYGTKARNWKET